MKKIEKLSFFRFLIVYLFFHFFISISLSAQEIIIFPQPRKMEIYGGKQFKIRPDTKIIISPAPTESDRLSASELNDNIYNLAGFQLPVVEPPVQGPLKNIIVIGEYAKSKILKNLMDKNNIDFNQDELGEQGYLIFSNSDIVLLSGSKPAGTFYGVQSLIDIINSGKGKGINIPNLLIRDFPALKYRELFNEDKWGPDWMSLEDYKDMVDYMARIKMNSLSIGIYGCWGVQYRNEILEFFLLPVDKYPQIKTPKLIEYYSPEKAEWTKLDYLPKIFEDDFFGEIIKYGKKKYVTVYPKFNSLGHNTLLPRIFPGISAKDEQGNPTGYGFCTSNNETYKILFNIFDNIIDKYLKPNGVDWFDIELDEVRQWCKCEKCKNLSEEEIYLDHIIKLAKHLKSKGINHIGVWADMLNKKKMVNSHLVGKLEKEELKGNMILHWWRYTEPIYETIFPEFSLRNWVVPMTGYTYPYQFYYNCSRLNNVFDMLVLGHKSNAEGASSYSIYDPAYNLDITALSNFAWNPPASNQEKALDDYIKSYTKKIFGSQWKEAKLILENLDKFYPGNANIMRTILYYRHSYVNTKPYKKHPYPEEAFEALKKNSNSKDQLEKMAGITNNAARFFKSALNSKDTDRKIVIQFYANIFRASNLIEEFLLLYDIEEDYQKFKILSGKAGRLQLLKNIKNTTNKIFSLQMESIRTWEDVKPQFLHPHCMRNMSFMLKFCEENIKRIYELEEKVKNNSLKEIPESLITGTNKEL